MKKTEEIYELIAKKLSGEISEQELDFLNNWISLSTENQELYAKFESIWNQSADYSSDFSPNIPQAIIRYKKRIEKSLEIKKAKTRQIRIFQFAAAAAILIFLSYSINYYFTQNGVITVFADKATTKHVLLPDSSGVYLNKNTEIKYSKSFEKRVVKLNGEAFFEVKKLNGEAFIVETKNTIVKVLGTSFNIRARKDLINTELAVLSGKVQFTTHQTNKKLIVEPNQQAIFNSSTKEIIKSELKDNNFLVWKTGVLIFKNNRLQDVLKTLTDNYHVKFEVKDETLLELRLTCEFKNQKIDDILNEIEIILPLKLHSNNDLITIEAQN